MAITLLKCLSIFFHQIQKTADVAHIGALHDMQKYLYLSINGRNFGAWGSRLSAVALWKMVR